MYPFANPADKPAKLALRDLSHQVRKIAPRGLEQLSGDQRAERIGREIAPIAVVPVYILQTALAVVVGRNPEHVAHRRSPGGRQLRGVEIAVKHRALETVAQDDMSRVGHLVGIDPDESATDPDLPPV